MQIDKKNLQLTLRKIKKDKKGKYYIQTKFEALRWYISSEARIKKRTENKNLLGELNDVISCYDSIKTLIERINFEKKQLVDGTINLDRYHAHVPLDIAFVHVKARSIFEKIKQVILEVYEDEQSLKKHNYTGIIKLSENDRIKNKELVSLIKSSREWFHLIKEVRDDIIHIERTTDWKILVFQGLEEEEQITFQIYQKTDQGEKPKIISPLKTDYGEIELPTEFMYNENSVIIFNNYTIYFLSYLTEYLEKLAEIIIKKTKISNEKINEKLDNHYNYYGVETMKKWIEELLKII
ncbi:hypothetical protein ACFL24_02000 [Patescibacteria group bacterium]